MSVFEMSIPETTIFEALASPMRRAILVALGHGEMTPGKLVERLDLSQPAVSNHLRILRDAGIVRRRRRAQERLYSLRLEALHEAISFLASISPGAYCPVCKRPLEATELGPAS